jgi:hypothetical protein
MNAKGFAHSMVKFPKFEHETFRLMMRWLTPDITYDEKSALIFAVLKHPLWNLSNV